MIETVLGPIEAASLGVASMHDHLLSDARILHAPAREPLPEPPLVTLENLGFVRWNLLALEDNLVLDDASLAAAELARAYAEGQRAVVDLTCWGLGADPARLPAIARASGMHVIAGVGVYLDRPHPERVSALSESELVQEFERALTVSYDGCDFRAGLLGLLGTSEPVTAGELTALRAAGRAAAATGAAVTVRLDPAARRGPWVLDELAAVGCPPGQVIFGNVDEFLDVSYLKGLAAAGAVLEICFGNEAYYRDGYGDPTDGERLAGTLALLEAGLAGQIVLGCSVWTKSQLRAYGGMGYEHLLRRIVPTLRKRGVPDAQLDEMLIHNPARLLDR
ncbi:MAG TPA: phosphotriesterase [Conexibacter sp.]|nr:phosphotriesterase [Conexibacter sp.]